MTVMIRQYENRKTEIYDRTIGILKDFKRITETVKEKLAPTLIKNTADERISI